MYDLVVLGAGSGGLHLARRAARVGARVALIDPHGAEPGPARWASLASKALLRAAHAARAARGLGDLGVRTGSIEVDFAAVVGRARAVAEAATGAEPATEGITLFRGTPAFESYDCVVLDDGTRVEGQRFAIATGARPAPPPIPGLAEAMPLDATTVWGLTTRPESLTILGAGPFAIEFAQAFARLGSAVTLVATGPEILPGEDAEVAAAVRSAIEADGVRCVTGASPLDITTRDGSSVLRLRTAAGIDEIVAARLLGCTRRRPNIEGLNLGAIGVHADPERGIEVDDAGQTRAPHVYALGDATTRGGWAHAAQFEADLVFRNAVLRIPTRGDAPVIPRVLFTDPEVCAIGLPEAEALAREPHARVDRVDLAESARARLDGAALGFAKVISAPNGRILGAAVVGPDAVAIAQELVLAMQHGLGLAEIAATVHAFPGPSVPLKLLADRFVADRQDRSLLLSALRWLHGYGARAEGTEPRAEPSTEPGHAEIEHAAH